MCCYIRSTLLILTLLVAEKFGLASSASSIRKESPLRYKELRELEKLRDRVYSILPHEYMKDDTYLLGWLKAKNFDSVRAEIMLRNDLKWREEHGMDGILGEDVTTLDREFPYHIRYDDKKGRVAITANFGDWDLRKAAKARKLSPLNRHIERSFENATQQVRDLQASGKSGARWDFIINMESHSPARQICIRCLPFYVHLVNTYENHYPGHADEILLINTPSVFRVVLDVLRPMMSSSTQRSLKIHYIDKHCPFCQHSSRGGSNWY